MKGNKWVLKYLEDAEEKDRNRSIAEWSFYHSVFNGNQPNEELQSIVPEYGGLYKFVITNEQEKTKLEKCKYFWANMTTGRQSL